MYVSPIVANLFMEAYEVRALASFRRPPRYWGRYVDDVIAVIKSEIISEFTAHLNSQHPSIQWTSELEKDGSIPMLDTLTTRLDDGSVKFQVYSKPTHTDAYLQFDSHQPLEHKMGVIRTLRHRAKTIITKPEDNEAELQHLRKVLSISGYPKWAWHAPGGNKTTPHPKADQPRPKGHITLPFISGITEPICRLVRKAGVAAHVRPHQTIRRMLVAPKDKDEMNKKCDTVYHLRCADCPAEYVGESGKSLRTRISQHTRPDSRPVGEHLSEYSHKLDKEATKVLEQESRYFQRGVREAIFIRACAPSLNRDAGRHHLPRIYDTLVKSCDTRAVAEVSHDRMSVTQGTDLGHMTGLPRA